jgi:hypothetical protein
VWVEVGTIGSEDRPIFVEHFTSVVVPTNA